MRLRLILIIGLTAVVAGGCSRAAPVPAKLSANLQKIELRQSKSSSNELVVTNILPPLSSQMRDSCERGSVPWTQYFLVTTQDPASVQRDELPTPILGDCRIDGNELRFTPRFPIQKGLTMHAFFSPLGRMKEEFSDSAFRGFPRFISESFTLPKASPLEDTKVTAVYPSAGTLPENQLKFYLHFSGPMSRGQAYECIHLFEAGGKEVDMPFLELDEELWDPAGTRFTLFFDPGRIKRDLKPRLEVGPALVEGRSYALVIEGKWRDAEGNPLKASFRKEFKVGPPDDQQPDPKKWVVQAPQAGTKEAVIVAFPESMDRGLLDRVVAIVDAAGKPVTGKVRITDLERRWEFTPEQPWQAGAYHLVAEAILEDLAGNNLSRPFEVDLLRPIQREVATETIKLPFEIK